jgi:hypothetical protein
MRKPALSRKFTPKIRVTAKGGPWDCYALMIPAGGSMVFRLGNWHGHYDEKGIWHEL